MGTSNIKAVLVDEKLSIQASAEREVVYIPDNDGLPRGVGAETSDDAGGGCPVLPPNGTNNNNFKEIDPEYLFGLICDILSELASSADNVGNIKAVCFSGATGNTMLLDKANKPLTNIISWLDTREVEPELTKEEVYPITGWPVTEIFPIAHISWWKQKRPETFKKAKRIVMNNDYITYRLSGQFVLDYSTASTFILLNQLQRKWHKPFLEKLNIKEEQLSSPVPSGSVIGNIIDEIASKTGLFSNTAIVAGSFDHPSAALACNITAPGDLLLSCGTSWVGFYPISDRDQIIAQKMLVDPFLSPDGPWGGIFSIPKVGNIFDQWVDALFGEKNYKAFDSSAEKSPKNANGLKIDIINQSSPGNMKQIIDTEKTEDICRALMVSTANIMHKKIADFAKAGIKADDITMVGGPTKSRIWIQILTETIGKKIKIHKSGQYAGALGAAMYAKNVSQ